MGAAQPLETHAMKLTVHCFCADVNELFTQQTTGSSYTPVLISLTYIDIIFVSDLFF